MDYFQKNRKFDILKKNIDRNTVYKHWKYCHRQSPIKIYPEWNVNSFKCERLIKKKAIKIYPEWNVNTRSEVDYSRYEDIKIYPEWNVNEEMDLDNPKLAELKSIQSGM